MNDQDKKNIEELLGKFSDAEQAAQAADEIQKGEEIFRLNPAPEPDNGLIKDIKAEIVRQLRHQRATHFAPVTYKTAAIAAGLVILAIISARFLIRPALENESRTGVSAAAIVGQEFWESEDTATNEGALTALRAEVEQIKSDMLAIRLNEQNSGNGNILSGLEMELVEINSLFWEG